MKDKPIKNIDEKRFIDALNAVNLAHSYLVNKNSLGRPFTPEEYYQLKRAIKGLANEIEMEIHNPLPF